MATIYTHITGGGTGDNCLILEPRERLIYPFSFGDYSEVRWGMIYSWAPSTGNNGPIISDSSLPTDASQWAYIGLSHSGFEKTAFPGQPDGFDFIGIGPGIPQSTVGIANDGTFLAYVLGGAGGRQNYCLTSQNGVIASGDAGSIIYMAMTPQSGVFGTTKFSSMFGQRFINSNNTFQTQWFANQNASSNTSSEYLKTGIFSMTSLSSAITGFFTSGGNNTDDRLIKPNSIYIYNPMLSTKMRIHNISAERYA